MKVFAAGVSEDGEIACFEIQIVPIFGEKDLITGYIGESLVDSTLLALTLYRIRKNDWNQKFHIHFSNSEIFKNGPSAGLAIYVKLVFLNSLNKYTALITGELDLHGRVIEVGGISQKYQLYLHGNKFNKFLAPIDNFFEGMEGTYIQHIDDINWEGMEWN